MQPGFIHTRCVSVTHRYKPIMLTAANMKAQAASAQQGRRPAAAFSKQGLVARSVRVARTSGSSQVPGPPGTTALGGQSKAALSLGSRPFYRSASRQGNRSGRASLLPHIGTQRAPQCCARACALRCRSRCHRMQSMQPPAGRRCLTSLLHSDVAPLASPGPPHPQQQPQRVARRAPAPAAAVAAERTPAVVGDNPYKQPAGKGLGWYTGEDGYMYVDNLKVDDIRAEVCLTTV
jgi:hypothetical protein